ncbi:unnamed protein product [Fraxinus pennsylvanica]|uniref:Uncharacterized protein n=1 Tax=Fraxinus pennsylvanica TaxID=56036 RepID=A0AAD2A8E2_9LAMI|nr:unnamed protein product [Fraxinus pennsylvanica]
MLNKIFGHKKPSPPPFNHHAPPWTTDPPPKKGFQAFRGPAEKGLRALKIVHAGGSAEYYYMAIPATRIIEKYPSFILTRPEVFRRPWDSIVRPEEILVPGQKFYIVPRRTVKKLRRRIKKTSSELGETNVSQQKNKFSTSSIMAKSGSNKKARNHRVRFFGIDVTAKQESDSVPSNRKVGSVPSDKKKPKKLGTDGKKRMARYSSAWEPSLTSINETSGPDD